MDNQKLFLVIAIGVTVFLLWDQWEVKQTTDVNGNVITQTNITAFDSDEQASDIPITAISAITAPDSVPSSSNESITRSAFTTVTTDLLTVEISHRGGTIQSAYLSTYDNELDSESKFQLLSNDSSNIFQAQSGLWPTEQLPDERAEYSSEKQSYFLGDSNELIVPLTWHGDNGVIVTKNYRFTPDSYTIAVDYVVTNNSAEAQSAGTYTRLTRSAVEGGSSLMMQNFAGGAFYVKNAEDDGVFEKFDFDEFDEQPAKTISTGGWAAMIQHYFFAAWIPDASMPSTYTAKTEQGKYVLTTVNPSVSVAPGTQVVLASNELYVGPKEHARLENLAEGLDKTVDYSFLYIFAKPLSTFLHWIYSFINSWGFAIIAVTLTIKLAFYKLSEKSYRSMAGMRKLAPRLTKIKETYGDDKQKIGKKTMELYKKEKVNPAAGCLPILVQIPVFISMYWVLQEMVELRHASFFYLPDLSARDPYFIMPLIMGASMWFQQGLNPPPADPMQAKIMKLLPIVFTVFFLFFPAGLVLYWVTNNLLSIAQQMFINKRYGEKKEA
ncbi:MAG: membrane protein insertase YidC [Gammaproteobacteria bacterium]|nr:membrane protein insertase YidC [Gammaproteobacteria bacterium]